MLQVINQVHHNAAQLSAQQSGQLAVVQYKAAERKRKLELVQGDVTQERRARQQSDARCGQLQAENEGLKYRDMVHRGHL
jgi:hypothetical protein